MTSLQRTGAALRWLLLAVALTAGYLATTGGPKVAAYAALGFGACAAIVCAIRRHRPARPRGWWLLAAGVGAWAVADLCWSYTPLVHHRDAPFPGPADALYLVGYGLLAWGLSLLTPPSDDRTSVALDALTLVMGITVVSWGPLLDPLLGAEHHSLGAVVSLAYPVGDLVLAAMAVRLLLAGARRRPALLLLGLAAFATLVADIGFAWLANRGLYRSGDYVDLGWICAYALFGAAALHPSMAGVGAVERTRHLPGRGRLIGLWVVAAAGPVECWWAVRTGARDATALVVASGLTGLLVLARATHLLREQARAAGRDVLTGLGNRNRVVEALDAELRRAPTTSVLLLDLDRFQGVNDHLGHAAGDRLLVAVAARLVESVPSDCLVGRTGGDEFAVVCPDRTRTDAERLADGVLEALRQPFAVGDQVFRASASIGVALAGPDADADGLLVDADAAMCAAKAAGKGRWRTFQASLREDNRRCRDVEQELHRALADDELRVHYQPVVDLETGAITGAEALVRWQHPTAGLLCPAAFIPVAEDTGQIIAIGRHVLRTAMEDMRSLPDDLTVAVNLSARQFEHGGLLDEVRQAAASADVDPSRLVLEITESVLVDGTSAAHGQIDALRRLGVRFAIDDFGTGFSSLSRLKELPAAIVKIDRSFVAGIAEDAKDRTIVAGVTYLAHGLGLEVVAEGVETVSQQEALRSLGCGLAQGFLWSPAVDIDELRALVGTRASR